MDPLSVTTGILAILTAVGGVAQTIEKIRDLRNAPKELKLLLRESHLVRHSLQGVFDVLGHAADDPDVEGWAQSESASGGCIDALSQALNAAQCELGHLDALLQASIRPLQGQPDTSLISPSASNSTARPDDVTPLFKVDFLAYSRNRPKIKASKEALQAVRNHISLCLGSLNVKVTAERTRSLQRQINVATAALALNQAELFATVAENSRLLQQILLTFPSPTNPSAGITPATSQITQHAPAPETMKNLITEKGEAPLLPLAFARSPRCPIWCTCTCHRKLHVSTLETIAPVTGSTHLVVSGGPLKKPCSDASCRRHEATAMQLNFFPPAWAWSRMVRLSIALNPLTGLQISMRTPRLVCGSHRVFHFALGGNVDALRKAFLDGQGSPFDVDGRTGSTLLHLAAVNRHSNLFAALLAAGADPLQEDKQKRTPADVVWDYVLHESADKASWKTLTSHEEMEDLETRRFSPLHKVVLGLTPLSLPDYLDVTVRNEIDAPDVQGRTPLSWASARGDVAAIRALLRAGADVGAACQRTGKTPLHFAFEKGYVPAVIALLDAGADVDAVDAEGRSVLHIAAVATELNGGAAEDTGAETEADRVVRVGVSIFDALRGRDLNLEARDATGATPLLLAAGQGNMRAVMFLLGAGAHIETADDWGYTPFLQALCYNHVDVLTALLNRGADYRKITTTAYAMTHLVAHYASAETMKMLSHRKLGGVDPAERNGKGLTPRDILEVARPDASEELRAAFEELLRGWELSRGTERHSESVLEGLFV